MPYYVVTVTDSAGKFIAGADAQGWIYAPFVEHRPGIADKVYSAPNACIGQACHSVVGKESEFADGVPNRFLDTSKLSNGRRYTSYAAASCQIVLRLYDTLAAGWATVIQMYPMRASTWTSSSRAANTQYMAWEAEGGLYPNYGEPLNARQVRSYTWITLLQEKWVQWYFDRPDFRLVPEQNILQHKDLVEKYGGGATACASDRYDNAWEALERLRWENEQDMIDEEARQSVAALEESIELYNDIAVIERDVRRAANGPHPHVWKVHKALRDAGLLIEPEYEGDYKPYA